MLVVEVAQRLGQCVANTMLNPIQYMQRCTQASPQVDMLPYTHIQRYIGPELRRVSKKIVWGCRLGCSAYGRHLRLRCLIVAPLYASVTAA